MSFESRRKLLIKVLNEAHMDRNISLDKFGEIVGNIMLTFSNKEILMESKGRNRAFNISIKCLDHLLTRALIDNGSSLNVMPKATLEKFPYDKARVGPFIFQISFQVMWTLDWHIVACSVGLGFTQSVLSHLPYIKSSNS
ncbi:hypothetical protein CR513_22746, partial [Mucuna pruriens]